MGYKICLDAGHYGSYNRSPAVQEYYESHMNWKLHLFLKAELEKRGFQVVTTRQDRETDLALEARGKASRGCDLFLSLHSNAAGSGVYENVDYVVAHVMLDGSGDKLGLALAQAVAAAMGTVQKPYTNTRAGSNGEYYGVLRGAAAVGTPGIILEHSFHTQTRATRWLLKEENLKKLAVAEAQVIAEYFAVTAAPVQWYRIRKTWADVESQMGAFRELALAKSACPAGYQVFDGSGKAVYTPELTWGQKLGLPQLSDPVKAQDVLALLESYHEKTHK